MARRLLVTAIIAICLGGPIVEMLDRWDQTLTDGNDTEADVVVAALCVGAALAIGTIVVARRIRAFSSTFAGPVLTSRFSVRELTLLLAPVPASSPPSVLRV